MDPKDAFKASMFTTEHGVLVIGRDDFKRIITTLNRAHSLEIEVLAKKIKKLKKADMFERMFEDED